MKVITSDIRIVDNFQKWRAFLVKCGITRFSEQEIASIDKTFIWLNSAEEIIATGSIAGEILKYIAIDINYQEQGTMFNEVVSFLINQAALLSRYHLFVFTKASYFKSFMYVGFKLLATIDDSALLETGVPTITDYLAKIPKIKKQKNKRIAGIVVNANPFTLGHRYLIETASKENDLVYVFVVSQDVSLFSFKERFTLVKQGTIDLKNVVIVPGDEYMVSYATFPAYFLKDDQNLGVYQARLDAELFKVQIAKILNITWRYLGKEPYSKTTAAYNKELMGILPPEVKVKIIERLQNQQSQIITATAVRQAIKNNKQDVIKTLVPKTTLNYLVQHWDEIRLRFLKKDGD